MIYRPTRIAHISDIHLRVDDEHGDFAALQHFFDEFDDPIDVLVVSGDLVYATPNIEEFGAANNALADLLNRMEGETRLVVCPGNHDYRWRGIVNGWPILRRNKKLFERIFTSAVTGPVQIADGGVLIYPFDSSEESSHVGAGGKISKESLSRFREYMKQFGHNYPIRIAVLHHHLLPVPEVDSNVSERRKERWMVMDNPGEVLSTLLKQDVMCVLHGHQHLPSHWRIGRTAGGKNQQMEVIGCGSSTIGKPSCVNIIEFHPGCSAVLHRFERQWRAPEFARVGEFKHLFPRGYFARKTQAAHSKRRSHRTVYMCRHVRFHEHGDLTNEQIYKDTRFYRSIDQIPVVFGCDIGVHGHVTVKRIDESAHSSLGWKAPEHPTLRHKMRFVDGAIQLPAAAAKNQTMSFSVSSYVSNAFALTSEERCIASKAQSLFLDFVEHDFVGFDVIDLIDTLELCVEFPHELYVRDVGVVVVRVHDDGCEEKLPEETRVAQKGVVRLQSRAVVKLFIQQPVVGNKYVIYWRLPTIIELGGMEATADTKAARRILLENIGKAKSRVSARAQSVEDLIGGRCCVGLMTLDADSGWLVHVGTNDDQYADIKLLIGEGVAGRAFKLGECVLWTDAGEREQRRYWYKAVPGMRRHKAVLAIPVRHPEVTNGEKQIVGPVAAVVCFSAYQQGTILEKMALRQVGDDICNQTLKALEKHAMELVLEIAVESTMVA